jgi:hypothetical protein
MDHPWVARHNLTSAEYQSVFNSLAAVGYQLISLSGYAIDGQPRYAAIWKQASGPDWIARHGMPRAEFQETFTDLPAQGYVPAQVGGYRVTLTFNSSRSGNDSTMFSGKRIME